MSAFEDKVAAQLESEGWTVYRNGWPDMLAVKTVGGKTLVRAAEAKSKKDVFHGNQLNVLYALADRVQTEVFNESPSGAIERSDLSAMFSSYDKKFESGE